MKSVAMRPTRTSTVTWAVPSTDARTISAGWPTRVWISTMEVEMAALRPPTMGVMTSTVAFAEVKKPVYLLVNIQTTVNDIESTYGAPGHGQQPQR